MVIVAAEFGDMERIDASAVAWAAPSVVARRAVTSGVGEEEEELFVRAEDVKDSLKEGMEGDTREGSVLVAVRRGSSRVGS